MSQFSLHRHSPKPVYLASFTCITSESWLPSTEDVIRHPGNVGGINSVRTGSRHRLPVFGCPVGHWLAQLLGSHQSCLLSSWNRLSCLQMEASNWRIQLKRLKLLKTSSSFSASNKRNYLSTKHESDETNVSLENVILAIHRILFKRKKKPMRAWKVYKRRRQPISCVNDTAAWFRYALLTSVCPQTLTAFKGQFSWNLHVIDTYCA